jgi:hypothetical protein
MALTRAVSDFKDSVKAATTTNITLAGGAPTTVDGISILVNDSILVRSQSDPTQNGLYRVTTLGTGANGTWTRRSDFNAANQISGGVLIFVEQGTANGNVFYYLPGGLGTVTVGSTALNFSNLYATIGGNISANIAAFLTTYQGALTANTFTGVAAYAATIGNTGTSLVGTLSTAAQTNITSVGTLGSLAVTGAVQGNTHTGVAVYAGTIGNSGATLVGTLNGAANGPHNGTVGATTPNTGAFTTLTTTGNITAGGNINITGNIVPSANVTYSLGTPTLRFKNLYLSGNTIDLDGTSISSTAAGALIVTSLVANAAIQGNTFAGIAVYGATIGNTGAALQGASIAVTGASTANTYTGIAVYGSTIGNTGATLTGTVSTATQNNITTMTGLTGFGTAGVTTTAAGNFTIVGNLAVQGNTSTIGSTDIVVQDSIINLHTYANLAPWTVNDGRDIGIKFHYYDNADKHAFLGRDNATGFLEFFANGTENASNVFTGTEFGTIKGGALIAANTTVSTSTATGALQVSGGAGVAGAVYANNFSGISVYAGTIGNTGATHTGSTFNATGAVTGNTFTGIAVYGNTIGNTNSTHVGVIGTNAQPFITSLGTLSSLASSGNVTLSNNQSLRFTTVGGSYVSLIQQNDDNFVLYSTNTSGNQRAIWSVFANSTTSLMSMAAGIGLSVNTISIASGGGIIWAANSAAYSSGGGGSGTPGGANTQVQFNDAGSFGGSSTFTFNKGSGLVTADSFAATNNGAGNNFKVGDDVWIGDINVSNTMGVKGQQDGTQGYIVFGSSNNTTYIGRSGTGPITVTGNLSATGNVGIGTTSPAATLHVVGNIYGYHNGAIGANTANTGAFTTVSAAGNVSLTSNSFWVIANNFATTAGSNGNIFLDPDGIGDVVLSTGTELVLLSSARANNVNTGTMVTAGGIGANGNVYVGGNVYTANRVGFTYTGNGTALAYTYYNLSSNSIDTVFGS